MSKRWKKIGSVGVDSGRVLIVDPCYAKDAAKYIALGPEPCDEHQYYFEAGPPCAVVSSTGVGDGIFPVEVRRDEDGTITELRVRFRHE